MNKYCIETKYGKYVIEAAELETCYDEKQGVEYVSAFDEGGQCVAYLKEVIWWLLINPNNKIMLNAEEIREPLYYGE